MKLFYNIIIITLLYITWPVDAIIHQLSVSGSKITNSTDVCYGVICRAGRECRRSAAVTGHATCECIRSCPNHKSRYRPICASDGHTYFNYCDYHRASCLQGDNSTMRVVKKGRCLSEHAKSCTIKQRDELISRAAKLLNKGESLPPKCKVSLLQMDAEGLLKCFTSENIVHKTHEIESKICTEAVLAAADKNKDFLLSEVEFTEMLRSNFIPMTQKCSFKDKIFIEGAHVTVECNTCLCASGRWICGSSQECEQKDMGTLHHKFAKHTKLQKRRYQNRLRPVKAKEWDV